MPKVIPFFYCIVHFAVATTSSLKFQANEARATSLLTELKQIDPMRSGYYDYQQEVLRKLIKDCKVC